MSGTQLPIWGSQAGQWLRLDCRHYRGDRPCAAGVQGVCPSDCVHDSPMGHRILIIKLGALGDVIRTAALLPGIKERWPASHITWVSRQSGVRALANHPLIDRRLPFDAETVCHLEHERFDVCFSLDKEPGPTALAMRVDARERYGIGLSRYGTVYPLNPECAAYFALGLNDDLKFRHNTKSYPQLIYEAVGLQYSGQPYTLHPDDDDQEYARELWARLGIRNGDTVVGLNTGAGNVFANKSWPPEKFGQLAERLMRRPGFRIALLGGPGEQERNARLANELPGVVDTGSTHAELEFAALLDRCQVVVTGDTMALHVAVARRVPCVALFGPTCPQEIDLFGRGEKIVTRLPCAPCYRRSCDLSPSCMDDVSLDAVEHAVARWAGADAASPTATLPVVEVTS